MIRKELQLGLKEGAYEVGAKEAVDFQKIIIKKKPCCFHQDNRKDALKTFQEMARYHRFRM